MAEKVGRIFAWWPPSRDLVLFTFGLLGVAHETVIAEAPDPTLLIIFAGMMGLPAFLRSDEDKK